MHANTASQKRTALTCAQMFLRRFFCVCTLLFTINSQCSFSLHTLIADAIETCGGSTRLMRLLNYLGACTSPETHAQYVQYQVQRRKDEGPLAGYPDNAFAIVSADNLDFIHSYARVYSGNMQSSLHVTTVQVVQPKLLTLTKDSSVPVVPSTNDPSRDELCERSLTNKRMYSAWLQIKINLSRAPHKERRMRTGVEMAAATDQLCHSGIHTATVVVPPPTLSMDNFKLQTMEEEALNELRGASDNYILLKVASTTHDRRLTDFQTWLKIYPQ